MKDGNGKWIGYGLGDTGAQVHLIQHRLLADYPVNSQAHQLGVTESGTYDSATQQAVKNLQPFLKPPQPATGIANYATELAMGAALPQVPQKQSLFFSINGAGSTYNMGYPYDLGEAMDKGKVFHQPIGYNTNPFPMNTGVQDGIGEFIRQLDMPRPQFGGRNATQIPWQYNFYSMGAIVGMTTLMRIKNGDLQRFKQMCLGGATFGNPMRQHGHTFPGCSYSDGEGIVTPNASGCPDAHWDMAADKAMMGSPGDDLYTKIAKSGVDPGTVSDMRAVWDIINKGNPISLGVAVLLLLAHPSFTGGYDAAVAAFQALNFFVIKGVTPHTSYQFTMPIDGDGRDCWELAREHHVDLANRLETGVWV